MGAIVDTELEWWYFDMESDVYGIEVFGPYSTELDAKQGIERVKKAGRDLQDGVERFFGEPYTEREAREEAEDGR